MIINDINSLDFIEDDTIKLGQLFENEISFYVPKVKRLELLTKVINYIIEDNKYCYYYFFFGYHIYDIDMDEYIKIHHDLAKEHGFIRLEKEDLSNIKFISDILLEYQMASLYISNTPYLENKYTCSTIRDYGEVRNKVGKYMSSIIDGYSIKQWEGDYMSILRTSDCPPWNIDKMNIMMYYTKIEKKGEPEKKENIFIRLWNKFKGY